MLATLRFTKMALACAFLCLQSMSAHASVTKPSPDFSDPEPVEKNSSDKDQLRDSLDIAQPPPAVHNSKNEDVFFYRFHNALTFRAGETLDTKNSADGKGMLSLLGAQFMFAADGLESYESGADMLSDGTGSIHLSERYAFSQGRFRPYTKWGIGIRIVPSDLLITFLRFQHYQARGSIGFEQLISLPSSLRVEVEGTLSAETVQLGLNLGYVWAY